MSTLRSGQLMLETQSDADFHNLLVPRSIHNAPPVPPKDRPMSPSRTESTESFFVPEGLSRSNSVFSFSRASFGSQLSSLTSMTLPQAESLAAGVAALPTASKAVKALNTASEQIHLWTKKALKVLKNLDADDDVEWAAAAGREGLDETDKCVNKFENIVSVYIQAIEELQSRADIGDVSGEDLQAVVEQMETVLLSWDDVRKGLKNIHDQVELAMEWEELWSTVLGDVGTEMDSLSQLVFEMEEKRHMALQWPSQNDSTDGMDLHELETILGESSQAKTTSNDRFSLPPTFSASPMNSPINKKLQDDTNLLALFARMQPLRASLDFLPMRLSMFQARAAKVFPNACQELEEKRERIEKNWSQLTKEAENIRRELSEDRWVIVFRNAGRQAQKMCESVEKSILKLHESIDAGHRHSNPASFAQRVESFEAKKMHYVPAIERVLAIIQKGLRDRLTVNGEILRLHKDMSTRARELEEVIQDLDNILETMNARHNSKLRESISTIVSADRSFSSSSYIETPESSPASSVDLPAYRHDRMQPKYGLNGYTRARTQSSTASQSTVASKRPSIVPYARRPTTPSQSSGTISRRVVSSSATPSSVYRQGVYVPPTAPVSRPTPTQPAKPRWSSVPTAPPDGQFGQGYKLSSSTNPSPFRKTTPRTAQQPNPMPSPLSQEASSSPSDVRLAPAATRRTSQQFRSFAERVASPSLPYNIGPLMDPVPYHRGRNATAPAPGTIRSPSSLAMNDRQTARLNNAAPPVRPPSALSRSYAPRLSQPLSTQTVTANVARTLHKSEDSAIDMEADELRQPYEADSDSAGRQSTELSSSPITVRSVVSPVRSPSSLSGKASGKRMSMLPVPVPARGSSAALTIPMRGSSAGRQALAGNRTGS